MHNSIKSAFDSVLDLPLLLRVLLAWNKSTKFRNELKHEKATELLQLAIRQLQGLRREYPVTTARLWGALAATLDDLHRYPEAEQAYDTSISMLRSVCIASPLELPKLAMQLSNFGNTLTSMNRVDEATEAYKEAVEIRRDLVEKYGDMFKPKLAVSLEVYGRLRKNAGEPEKAKILFSEAIELVEANPVDPTDVKSRASLLYAIADADAELGELHSCMNTLQTALGLYKSIGDKPAEGDCLQALGDAESRIGNFQSAIELTENAVELFRDLAYVSPGAYALRLASCLNNLGNIHKSKLGFAQAGKAFDECITIRRELASQQVTQRNKLASTLSNYGVMELVQGNLSHAEDLLEEANSIFHLADLRTEGNDWARLQHNLGTIYCQRDRVDLGLAALSKAARIRRELYELEPRTFGHQYALTLNCLATVLGNEGDIEEAKSAFGKAISIHGARFDSNLDDAQMYLADSLSNLGNLHSRLAEYDEAHTTYGQAVQIYRNLYDTDPARYSMGFGVVLHNLAGVYADLGNDNAAEQMYSEALVVRRKSAEVGTKRSIAELASTLTCYGKVEIAIGRSNEGLEKLRTAANLMKELEDSEPDSFTDLRIHTYKEVGFHLANKCLNENDNSFLAEATKWLEECLNSSDNIRLRFLSPTERRQITESIIHPTTLKLIDCFGKKLQLENNGKEEISRKLVAASESCRARGLQDIVANRRLPSQTPQSVLSLLKELRAKVMKFAQALHESECRATNSQPVLLPSEGGFSTAEMSELAFKNNSTELRENYRLAAEEYSNLVQKIRREFDPDFFPDGRPASTSIDALQTSLDDRSAVIQLTTTERSTYAAIVSRDQIHIIDLTFANEKAFTKLCVSWFESMAKSANEPAMDRWGNEIDAELQTLTENVIKPICDDIDSRVELLTFIHNRFTSRLPIALCRVSDSSRLCDKFAVSVSPCLAGVNPSIFPKLSVRQLTLLVENQSDLPIEREVSSVAKRNSEGQICILDLTDIEKLKKECPKSTVLHYCGHAHFSKLEPLESALGFEGDRHLISVRDIATQLNCQKGSLVYLNACQTSDFLTDVIDEYIGFVTAFTSIGARYVIGHLWEIEDFPAWLFADRFYYNLDSGLSVENSFAQTQLWIRGENDHLGESLSNGPALEDYIEQMSQNRNSSTEFDMEKALQESELWTYNEDAPPFENVAHWGGIVLTTCCL